MEVFMENDTKERILVAALEMFSQNGYAGTNIRELSASLGLVKSGVYKHFESKEAILCGPLWVGRTSAACTGFGGRACHDDDADGELHCA